MKRSSKFQRRYDQYRAIHSSALVVVLLFVTLMTILLIGFLASMQTESISAKSHHDRVTAGIYADAGVRTALAQLYGALGNPTNFYQSSPGRIITYGVSSSSTASTTLYTNSAYTNSSGIENNPLNGIPANEAVDLNPINLQYPGFLITQTNAVMPTSQMYVRWIYQHQDGTFDMNSPPLSGPSPIIGRFAYWVDDEATKINLNTARTRDSLNATNMSSPSRVGLDVLSTSATSTLNPTNIYTYAVTNHLNSVDEVGRAPNIPADVLQQKFSATAYSHSPDISMTGAPRILLTTQKWLADANGTTNFIDILATESTAPTPQAGFVDPGIIANLDQTKTKYILSKISSEIGATNWPFAPGKYFAQKYTGQSDINSLALNIIDYVRDVESTNVVVEPIRITSKSGTTMFTTFSTNNSPPPSLSPTVSLFSRGRKMYITEFGLNMAQSTTFIAVNGSGGNVPAGANVPSGANTIVAPFYIKIYLPYFPGNQYVDLTKYYIDEFGPFQVTAPSNLTNVAGNCPGALKIATTPTPISTHVIYPTLPPTKPYLYPGHTVTVTGNSYFFMTNIPPASPTPYPTWDPTKQLTLETPQFYIVSAPSSTNLWLEVARTYMYQTAVNGTINSYCVDDPMVNKHYLPNNAPSVISGDWIPTATPGFGYDGLTPSTNTAVGNLSTTSPEQDADANGNVTTNYAWVPAPNGDPNNPNGIVQSVGELGFVSTGGSDSETVNNSGTSKGVPWRTLHLQPQKNTSFLPDWAILDLFSAPIYTNVVSASSLPYVMPYNASSPSSITIPSRGGRININAVTFGFGPNNNPSLSTNRVLPLAALLNGARTNMLLPSVLGVADALNTANNILSYTPAVNGINYDAGKLYTNYYSPAQLAEVKGIADTGEASEAMVREICSLAAVNSNVFAIYTVGQALQQGSSGAIHVTGEERKEVIVERIIVPGSPPTVRFQTVFSREF